MFDLTSAKGHQLTWQVEIGNLPTGIEPGIRLHMTTTRYICPPRRVAARRGWQVSRNDLLNLSKGQRTALLGERNLSQIMV